jgi:hypothetical protein
MKSAKPAAKRRIPAYQTERDRMAPAKKAPAPAKPPMKK